MRNKTRLYSILLLLLAAVLLLSACVSKPERISDEELAALRKEYPYNDYTGTADFYFPATTFREINTPLYQYHAVAVVQLSDNWSKGKPKEVSPFENAPSYAVTTLQGLYCEAEVKQVLWGGEELKKGDKIQLGFGSTMAAAQLDTKNSFPSGETYVCFLFRSEEDGFIYYPASKFSSYRLTKDNVLLAISSLNAGFNECSGMYLDAFIPLVKEGSECRARDADPAGE